MVSQTTIKMCFWALMIGIKVSVAKLIADVINTQSHDVGKRTLMVSTHYNAVLPQLCD